MHFFLAVEISNIIYMKQESPRELRCLESSSTLTTLYVAVFSTLAHLPKYM